MNERAFARSRAESLSTQTARVERRIQESTESLLSHSRSMRMNREVEPLKLEALNARYQKIHERIMALGVLPGAIAFTVSGFVESQANTALNATGAQAGFMNLSIEQTEALLQFSKSGMAGAGVAIGAAFVLAIANTGVWSLAEQRLRKRESKHR